jgi:DNA polymerase III subunit gamma/tau
MIRKRGKGDLNKIYRPCRMDELIGHETQKRTIGNAIEKGTLPHAMLFTGPSGCGKTTFARIVALGLNCVQGPTMNPCCECNACKPTLRLGSLAVLEIDAGRSGDVGTTRRVLDELPSAPMGDENYKVIIFDEAHKLGGTSGSEDALLKVLEDTPEHVYIILCTNHPDKLKDVTLNRVKMTQFNRLTTDNIRGLLDQVCQFEGYDYRPEILEYIAEEAHGVPRAALSYLQQIASEGSWTKDAASMILNAGADIDQVEVINMCQVLIRTRNFKETLAVFSKVKNVPIEMVRIITCGFFIGCLKKARDASDASKYSKVSELFIDPYFNNPKPEHKLVNSLYKASRILREG